MATDCYDVFQKTYRQADTDGLSTAVAAEAAAAAMSACLTQQNTRPSTVATPLTTVKSGRVMDDGPTTGRQGQRLKEDDN